MSDFEGLWKPSVRYRRVSSELKPLLRDVYVAIEASDPAALRTALEHLLAFLAGAGRTDANCSTTDYFMTFAEPLWQSFPPDLRSIMDDMSGTLHDTIYAPDIAKTFEATPEQLLERVRKVGC
jgi:hypothetical protein